MKLHHIGVAVKDGVLVKDGVQGTGGYIAGKPYVGDFGLALKHSVMETTASTGPGGNSIVGSSIAGTRTDGSSVAATASSARESARLASPPIAA